MEALLTPLLTSYLDKYIKNFSPADLKLSLWGGDVVLSNLELQLDMLERDLRLPLAVSRHEKKKERKEKKEEKE
jgi:vacuolar protein sorting-associated protein 13B